MGIQSISATRQAIKICQRAYFVIPQKLPYAQQPVCRWRARCWFTLREWYIIASGFATGSGTQLTSNVSANTVLNLSGELNAKEIERSLCEGLTPEQKRAVRCIDRKKNLEIIACAGAGKTKTITLRIINLIAHGVHPGEIVASSRAQITDI